MMRTNDRLVKTPLGSVYLTGSGMQVFSHVFTMPVTFVDFIFQSYNQPPTPGVWNGQITLVGIQTEGIALPQPHNRTFHVGYEMYGDYLTYIGKIDSPDHLNPPIFVCEWSPWDRF